MNSANKKFRNKSARIHACIHRRCYEQVKQHFFLFSFLLYSEKKFGTESRKIHQFKHTTVT